MVLQPDHLRYEPDWVNIMRSSCLFQKGCLCALVDHPEWVLGSTAACIWSNMMDMINQLEFLWGPSLHLTDEKEKAKFLNFEKSVNDVIKLLE